MRRPPIGGLRLSCDVQIQFTSAHADRLREQARQRGRSCGGVEVRGVDVQGVPGARRLSNGATMTDSVRLVGKWDGTALNLTEPPRRATQSATSITHFPAEPTPRAAAALQRLVADERELKRLGIFVMESTTDGDNVVLLVPVADQRTVRTLEQRYGPVLVSAWLQRG